MSLPIDKDEIANLVKSVCGVFTTSYVLAYTIELVKFLEDESKKTPSPYKLLEREDLKDDRKSGYLTKEGAIRKNWKKRFFVVHHDMVVDYFADEKAAQKPKAKPRGTMNLAGYWVVEDPNAGLLKSATQLAEKMGIDLSQLPKPKEYPEHTFQINHYRRRSYFIRAADKKDYDDWVAMFKTVCWRAYGFKNRERVHTRAYHKAVRKTRWSLGRWGWWTYGGSEDQILSDIVSDEIDWQIMGKFYGKLSGPYMIRNTMRNNALKLIDSVVSAGVAPAWKAMAATVEELRPKIEPKIKELVDPIASAKNEILGKIKDGCLSVITPILEEHVNPHLSKIIEVIKSPVVDAFNEAYSIFDKHVTEFHNTTDLKDMSAGFRKLDWVPRSYWEMHDSTRKLDIMYEPLWLLHAIFPDIYPWSLIWRTQDELRTREDYAMHTFQTKVKKYLEKDAAAGKDAITKAKDKTMTRFKHDGAIIITAMYTEIIRGIVMPPFSKLVIPACKMILDPLQDALPGPVKEFIDIGEEFEKLLNGIIDGCIATLLSA